LQVYAFLRGAAPAEWSGNSSAFRVPAGDFCNQPHKVLDVDATDERMPAGAIARHRSWRTTSSFSLVSAEEFEPDLLHRHRQRLAVGEDQRPGIGHFRTVDTMAW